MDNLQAVTFRKPDDFHIHLRQDELLPFTLKYASHHFHRVLVMPNTVPPLTHTTLVQQYHENIQTILHENNWDLHCLMTLYLTETTTVQDIVKAKESGIIYACKLYPKNGTTNSGHGVSVHNIPTLYPVFEKMSELNIVLCIHGEVNSENIDIFEREHEFLENVLPDVLTKFPHLKIVLEHITTQEAVEFVKRAPCNVAATITPQHLWCNRNHMFEGGIRPHYYCLPILKTKMDQEMLIEAATSGHEKFFIGTDSAPHIKSRKESDCGCAGCFTGYNPVELYLDIFDRCGKLHNIEHFLSSNGARFYNLPLCDQYVCYERKNSLIPESFPIDSHEDIVPFLAGKETSFMKRIGGSLKQGT